MKFTVTFIALLSISASWAVQVQKSEESKDKREASVGYQSPSQQTSYQGSYQAPSHGQDANAISIGAGYSIGGKPSYSYAAPDTSGLQLSQEAFQSGGQSHQLAPIMLQSSQTYGSPDLSQLMAQISQGLNSGAISLSPYQSEGAHGGQDLTSQFAYAPQLQQYAAPQLQHYASEQIASVPSYAAGTKGLGSYSTGPVLFNPADSHASQASLTYSAPATGHSFGDVSALSPGAGHSFAGLSLGGGHSLGGLQSLGGAGYSLGGSGQSFGGHSLGASGQSLGDSGYSLGSSGLSLGSGQSLGGSGHSLGGSGHSLGGSGHSLGGSGHSLGGSGLSLGGSYKSLGGGYLVPGKGSFKPSVYLGSSGHGGSSHGLSGLSGSYGGGAPSFGGHSFSGGHGLSLGSGGHGASFEGSGGHGASFGGFGGSSKFLASYPKAGFGPHGPVAAFVSSGHSSSPPATTYGTPSGSHGIPTAAHAASSQSPKYYVMSKYPSSFGEGSSSYKAPASSHGSLSSYSSGPKYFSGHSSPSSRYGAPKDSHGAHSEVSYNTIKYSQELKPRVH